MKRKFSSVVIWAALTVVATATAGCMDYVKEAPGSSPQAASAAKHQHHHSGNPEGVPSSSPATSEDHALSGSWICTPPPAGGPTPSACDPDMLKIISMKDHSITTYKTIKTNGNQSICRVEETATLTLSESSDSSEYTGQTSDTKGQVADSAENTKNCADVVKGEYNGAAITPSDLVYTEKDGKLEIDGVVYHPAAASDLQGIASRHPGSASLAVSSLVGSWGYVDSDGDLDKITFKTGASSPAQPSTPGKSQASIPASDTVFTVTREWMIEFKDENLKCRVSEDLLVDIIDARQPTALSAKVTPSGERNPIALPGEDLEKCATAVQNWDTSEGPKTNVMDRVFIERDGSSKLNFRDQNYVLCADATCSGLGH